MTSFAFPGLTNVFLQIIQAPTANPTGVGQVWERWHENVAPGAIGWTQSIAGVTDDGQFIAVVEFVSEEAARNNQQRPEQDLWWRDLSAQLQGDATFHECSSVSQYGEALDDKASFVQVIQGRAAQIERLLGEVPQREHHHVYETDLDLMGGLIGIHDGGEFTEIVYYPSEDAARNPDTGGYRERGVSLIEFLADHVSDIRYLNLRDPWIHRH
ncbi:MAG: hypothetical protein M3N57_02810 [Actinomycetota bacterium]|nr:hypothetical protein [Actinomycetota bacterium]